jgi:HK97 gp10 family phage protein
MAVDGITSFELNPNLRDELHSFPAVQTSVKQAAEAIAATARANAPVETGRYRDGIVVNRAQTKGGVWRVAATDQKSSWIEFGNGKQEPQFVLRTAVESLGLKFKKGRA